MSWAEVVAFLISMATTCFLLWLFFRNGDL